MKKSIAFETFLFACMLISTIIILISMVKRDVILCEFAFFTFLLSAIALILQLRK